MMVDRPTLIMEIFLRIKRPGKEPGGAFTVLLSREYGEKRSVVPGCDSAVALAGDIHYLPVPDLATAPKGDRSCPDPAKGKSHLLEVGGIIMSQHRPSGRDPLLGGECHRNEQGGERHYYSHIVQCY